jgi:hypothetical protein
MSRSKLHKLQEILFNIFIFVTYFLIIVSSFGISDSAQKYLKLLDYYVRIYVCLFLIWRFNPFRSYYEFTNLDRKIAFSAGLLILTTTALNQYLNEIKDFLKQIF